MAYSAITNAEIDQDSPITQTLMTKYRDNIEEIRTFIVSSDASADATLNFTGFDAAKYDAYIFVLANVIPAEDSVNLILRTSTDGGSTYDAGSANYSYYGIRGTSGLTVGSTESASSTSVLLAASVGSNSNESGVSGPVWLFGPHLTRETQMTYELVFTNASNGIVAIKGGACRRSAADVNAVRFLFSTGNVESGTITMHGIRNA